MENIRRYDLDWLRIAGVFLVVIFHTMMIFILEPWAVVYIKADEYIHIFKYISSFIHIFHMPLMFIIAGMSVRFSIEKRTVKKFLQERFNKLFLPAVFGCIVLNPVMTYVYRISQGDKTGFLAYLSEYFTKNPGDLSGIEGGFTPAHFWFLIYLFVFSCMGLPLFLLWKKRRKFQYVNSKCILLFSIPLMLVSFVNLLDDKNPLPYFLDFLFGFYLISDDRYREELKKNRLIYAFTGVICGGIVIIMSEQVEKGVAQEILSGAFTQISSLAIIFALIGTGDIYWNRNSRVLRYLSAASFPVYVIHMLINTVVGFLVLRLAIPSLLKFFIILIVTVFLCLLVYELVRRIKNIKS